MLLTVAGACMLVATFALALCRTSARAEHEDVASRSAGTRDACAPINTAIENLDGDIPPITPSRTALRLLGPPLALERRGGTLPQVSSRRKSRRGRGPTELDGGRCFVTSSLRCPPSCRPATPDQLVRERWR